MADSSLANGITSLSRGCAGEGSLRNKERFHAISGAESLSTLREV